MPDAAGPRPRHFYTEPSCADVGGIRVAYRREGAGEPVLYLHGNGFTRMWLPFHQRLAARVDLLAPEHPGYGETEMPEWLDGFGDLVIHNDEQQRQNKHDTAHDNGNTHNDRSAAELAVFHPERLRSLT